MAARLHDPFQGARVRVARDIKAPRKECVLLLWI